MQDFTEIPTYYKIDKQQIFKEYSFLRERKINSIKRNPTKFIFMIDGRRFLLSNLYNTTKFTQY